MAIMIAILTLVFAAFAAFVIDVGALYEERRDLQNGADAAALAVAQACALGEITCPDSSAAQPIAEQFADANTNDGASRTLESEITWDGNEVTVVARTDDAGPDSDGDPNTLDHWFARIWGNGGTEVSADASATWGVPGGTTAFPITFSVCEWDDMTGGGSTFPTASTIIYFHNVSGGGGGGGSGGNPAAGECEFGPGQDIDGDGDRGPGGFGYLNATSCSAEITSGGFVQGNPGTGNPEQVLGCDVYGMLGTTILVPIFDDLVDASYCGAPSGQNCYHIYGFGALHVEVIDWGSGPAHWRNNPINICAPSDSCLQGYFERFVTLEEGLEILNGGGGPDLGVVVVVLSG